MAIKDQALKVQYTAWNTSTNTVETGDVGNHSLSLRLNGVTNSALNNSPSELANGQYEVQLTAAELGAAGMATLFGSSSTSNVVIIPTRFYVYDAAIFKADATAANQLAIKAQTDRIGSLEVTYQTPAVSNGHLSLYAGDDYLAADSRAISVEIQNYGGPDLTTATGKLRLSDKTTFDAAQTTADIDVVATISVNGSTVTVSADITAAQLAALSPYPPAAGGRRPTST